MTFMMFRVIRIVVLCAAVLLFVIGVSISSSVLKQIAFLIVIAWSIISVVLRSRYEKK